MKPMTARQRELVNLIKTLTEEKGFPPSRRELAKGLGNNSMNSITYMLKILRERGYVEWVPLISRSIKVSRRLEE